ncbi:MAG: ABC transporter substrate-binding protein [Sphingobacteriales bacterium]|nr:ABC transporter substrate-binding protein [Sphingobacteriales bacterium]
MNIGVLYPRSAAHPSIGLEFMDGIKTFFKLSGISSSFTITTENAGYGGVDKEVKEKIEKLLMTGGADILVLYIDQKIFTLVKSLLEVSGKLVIIVNPGADYPQSWEPSPNIIHLNLNHAFLCWLTGKLAANENKPQALMATSFYDCGYLHSAMMVNSFNLQGGQIKFNYVNNQAYNEGFHVNELISFLKTGNDTNKLLCIYDELPARMVYKMLNDYAGARQLQLFVSPMMLQPKALEILKEDCKFSVEGYMPWTETLNNKANSVFTQTILNETGKAASIFSLLGWEASMILQKVIESAINPRNGSNLVELLINNAIDTPRGEISLDKQTHWYVPPVVKVSVNKNSTETEWVAANNIIQEWKNFVSNPPVGVVSGWTNTYLCY